MRYAFAETPETMGAFVDAWHAGHVTRSVDARRAGMRA
jgi:hypothetical protein